MSLGIPAIKIGSGGTRRTRPLAGGMDRCGAGAVDPRHGRRACHRAGGRRDRLTGRWLHRTLAAGMRYTTPADGWLTGTPLSAPRSASEARYSGTWPRSRICVLRRYAAFRTSSPDAASRASMVASSTPAGFSIPTSTSPNAAPSGGEPARDPVRDRAGDQCRRRQATAAGHGHRSMPRLRREIAHGDVARALRRPDDADLRDRLALREFVRRHRPPAGALQRHAQAGLDPHRAQRRHEVAIALQRLDLLVRRLAEIGRARDHHRHRHIDAGDRVAGHLVHRAGRSAAADRSWRPPGWRGTGPRPGTRRPHRGSPP